MSTEKTPLDLWLEELRSGKHKQTRGRLHRSVMNPEGYPEGYCCLGVACVVYEREVGPIDPIDLPGEHTNWHVLAGLPEEVRAWLGVYSDDPRVDGAYLSAYNDNRRWTFKEIADLIESYRDQITAP